MSQTPPLLVFADDWGRHPSSCQYLIGHLLDRYDIYWVNTIGMRRPRLDLATLSRSFEKLGSWLGTSKARQENAGPRPRVLSPRMWPWFSSKLDRGLNRRLLGWQLGSLLRTLPEPPVVVTTIPIVADLIGVLPARRWVYYCVDDFAQWPGSDTAALGAMEERLVNQADVVIAVSETLRDRIAALGKTARLLTHGVEFEAWEPAEKTPALLPQLEGLERPLIVFWGLIDQRMDVNLVNRLADDLTSGTIVLAGPELDPDPALFASRRVVRIGSLPFEQLPGLANLAAVLIMPYADLPVTRAMQPLKLKEYLATSKPAVVRDLPATREWSDCLDLVATPEAFSQAVRGRLNDGLSAEQRQARIRLLDESWDQKARQFERWAMDAKVGLNGSHAG